VVPSDIRAAIWAALAAVLVAAPAAGAPEGTTAPPEAPAIEKVVADYGRAIETKDISLFKSVKPNLSASEEQRLRAGFAAVKSQNVRVTLVSLDVDGAAAVVRIMRRDTINGSIVSTFPQTLRLARGGAAWSIVEIGK
jgi:hypothetical protein